MSTLAMLAAEYREAASILADLDLDQKTVGDTLDGISGALEDKARAVAHVIRSLEAEADSIADWAKSAQERARSTKNRAEHLRAYLAATLRACSIQRVAAADVVISFGHVSSVVIDDPDALPGDLLRYPPPEPNKTAIAAAIKSGAAVPGAHIEEREYIRIK